MIQAIPVWEDNIFAFRATGKLTHDDYQRFLPTLEALIKDVGKVSILLELENFHGWELAAALDDYRFGKEHDKDFERIAIVGDKEWMHWLAILTRPFVEGEVRYFDHDEIQQAWDWLRHKDESEEEATSADGALPGWKRILAPVDFSPHTELALKRAIQLSRAHDASLTLLHAVELLAVYDDFYDPVVPMNAEMELQLVASAEKRLAELARRLGVEDADQQVIVGTPKAVILNAIVAQRVDLVVIGSHGRKGLSRLLGSTTSAVANAAQCELLSVPIR